MAEVEASSGGGHKKGPGVKKGKKLSTRIDLTPMVDLGFLLITFFMLTTSLAKQKTMTLNMPFVDKEHPPVDPPKIKETEALTVLLSKNHRVYTYEGIGSDPNNPPKLVPVSISNNTEKLRKILIDKKANVDAQKRSGALTAKDQLYVLIKADTTSTYKDFVDVIDEMNINDLTASSIVVDISPQDREFIKLTEDANAGK